MMGRDYKSHKGMVLIIKNNYHLDKTKHTSHKLDWIVEQWSGTIRKSYKNPYKYHWEASTERVPFLLYHLVTVTFQSIYF